MQHKYSKNYRVKNLRNMRMASIASPISKLTDHIFAKRGFLNSNVVSNWHSIVGTVIAKVSLPERITFPKGINNDGVIHLRVTTSAFATEIQHLQPLILERINTYFGYNAVSGLRIGHGHIVTNSNLQMTTDLPLDTHSKEFLKIKLREISDPELRAAIKRLGQAVLKKNKKL